MRRKVSELFPTVRTISPNCHARRR